MKIAIISLGCPKNQVDADVFCHALIKDGHTTVADPAEADIIIINTCGFIESAKTEAIENILMACQYKQENPDLKVIVTGCLAERYKQQIIQEIPEVDAVVGIGSNAALPAIVRRVCADGAGQIESYGPKSDMQLGGARVISTPRHYAYLKIAEGCNNGCYYCAIPLIRGALRSREINDCVAEARWLAGEGVRELILVAQDPTAYGEDWGRPGAICELLDRLQEIDGIRWIRILYAYPERISDAFIAAMVRNTKVVPYLDLPIQHCDDAVLKAMNRRGDPQRLLLARRDPLDTKDARLSLRKRARLVESQRAQLPDGLQVRTAFHQHAAAGERRRVGIVPHKLRTRLYRADDPLDSLDDVAKVKLLERLEAMARAEDPRVKEAYLGAGHE
jgi:ribosomal protein S12 methylthiotransferase